MRVLTKKNFSKAVPVCNLKYKIVYCTQKFTEVLRKYHKM